MCPICRSSSRFSFFVFHKAVFTFQQVEERLTAIAVGKVTFRRVLGIVGALSNCGSCEQGVLQQRRGCDHVQRPDASASVSYPPRNTILLNALPQDNTTVTSTTTTEQSTRAGRGLKGCWREGRKLDLDVPNASRSQI